MAYHCPGALFDATFGMICPAGRVCAGADNGVAPNCSATSTDMSPADITAENTPRRTGVFNLFGGRWRAPAERYESGTDWPASTQMYSHAAPPASASSAATATTAGLSGPRAASNATGSTPPPMMAAPQNSRE